MFSKIKLILIKIYNSENNENVGIIESNIVENKVYVFPESEIQNFSS